MKCPYCNAEIPSDTKKCPYCRSEIKEEKNNVNITNNYYGSGYSQSNSDNDAHTSVQCPKCGSNKIKFTREDAGYTSAR